MVHGASWLPMRASARIELRAMPDGRREGQSQRKCLSAIEVLHKQRSFNEELFTFTGGNLWKTGGRIALSVFIHMKMLLRNA